MPSSFLMSFLLSFLLSFLSVVLVVSVVSASPVKYDDLALKKCKDDHTYSIHGWWPEYTERTYPQWCNKTVFKNFTIANVQALLSDLNRYACPEWHMTNEQMWFHEINKHGSCISGLTMKNVGVYFSHTLEAYKSALLNQPIWFGCCTSSTTTTECLLPFDKLLNETKWLNYCHNGFF